MRNTVVVMGTAIALILVASFSIAQQPAPADRAFFEQHLNELVTLKPTRLTNPAVGQVLAGDVFQLEIIVADSGSSVLAAREGNSLVQLTLPSTTSPMPSFVKVIKPGFKLASDETAHQFQDALDILYPIERDDAAAKTMTHTGTEWTFIRGKFFDHFKGFVVTTDGAGGITAVQYSLDLAGK